MPTELKPPIKPSQHLAHPPANPSIVLYVSTITIILMNVTIVVKSSAMYARNPTMMTRTAGTRRENKSKMGNQVKKQKTEVTSIMGRQCRLKKRLHS